MLLEDYTESLDRAFGYLWFWRLRWVEAVSLLLGATAAHIFLQSKLPWWVLGTVLGTLVLSNFLAQPGRAFVKEKNQICAFSLLTLDLVLLTLLLYFTGGAHNPFTLLYLLLVVLAVILLPSLAAWGLVLATLLAFGLLFSSPFMLINETGDILSSDLDFHLQGMVLGLAMTGAGVVYFVSSLKRVLREKHTEVEELRKKMAEQRKLVEMSAVIATLAHEVATPLGTIAVIGQDLASVDCAPEYRRQLQEDARLIQDSVSRCRQVLQWVSARASGAVPDDFQAITAVLFKDQLLSFLNSEERRRLRLTIAGEGHRAVRVSLQQLVISTAMLIRNGLDASDEEGLVYLHWESDQEHVRISVTDNGCGMSKAVQAKIKEPFFTTKTSEKGFGLGLYLVNSFSERQQGTLEINSKPGGGTVATLHLPASV